jgi:uncharacterized protein (TIGR00255 family)
MNLASMTGFARLESSGPWGTLVCELRSVNHRFLDVSLRLPDSCRALESDLRGRLQAGLRRGKVDCTVQHRTQAGGVAALEIDENLLGQVLAAARRVLEVAPEGTGQLNAVDVLHWPGVVRDDPSALQALPAACAELFEATVRELQTARQREGARLGELIDQRCEALAGLVADVRRRLPEVHQRVRARLEERLGELGAELNKDRIEQEIVLLLQRLDVAEELDRLTGHITEARRTMAAPEPAGRRLDFLLQEFNREANTLSSKSQDLETTRAAVEMKVLIEQMREQVQNIE